jgi:hypothetical protein
MQRRHYRGAGPRRYPLPTMRTAAALPVTESRARTACNDERVNLFQPRRSIRRMPSRRQFIGALGATLAAPGGGAVPGRDLGHRRHAGAHRRGQLPRRGQGRHAWRPSCAPTCSAAGCSGSSDSAPSRWTSAAPSTPPSGARAAPTRWWAARSRGWPTAARRALQAVGRRARRTAAGPEQAGGAGRPALAAHRVADEIYQALTGERGVFATRIAYVVRSGRRHTLHVTDADGEGGRWRWPAPSPSSRRPGRPTARELAYVSFETQKAVVWVQNVPAASGVQLANFRGSNSAPAWSPDGRELAVTLSRRHRAAVRDAARRRHAAAPDQQQRHRHRGRLQPRRPQRLLRQRPRRRPADLPRAGRRRRAERVTFAGALQHQPGDQPRRQADGLRGAPGQRRLQAGHAGPRAGGVRAAPADRHQRRREPELRTQRPPHRLHLAREGARRVDDHHARWQDQDAPGQQRRRHARTRLGPVSDDR